MKKLILILCTSLALFACSDQYDELDKNETNNLRDCTSAYNGSSNNVTKDDILNLKKAQMRITRGSYTTENKLYCIKSNESDTLLFVCDDTQGGWTIYSSDRRVPAIVAQSDSGSFEKIMENENAYAWILTMAEDMKVIKRLKDSELNFSEKEIENNKQFWESISSPDKYVKKQLKTTRSIIPPDDPQIIPDGHYVLNNSYSYNETYDSSSRLTTTNWTQNFPFNIYCPIRTDNDGHAPAGCVVVAGAQMLFFLNGQFGVPETAPSEAYCNSHVGETLDWAQYNYTSSVWNTMNTSGHYEDAAPLMADIGRRLNAQYSDDATSASLQCLVDNVFEAYGIDCDYLLYNTDILKTNLLQGFPVILSAFSSQPNGSIGHAFIADRYKRERTVTVNTYYWEYDYYPPQTQLPYVPEMVQYSYSSPFITKIGMNWGWGLYYNDLTEWYALTGDWIIDGDNYTANRAMVCNFEVSH